MLLLLAACAIGPGQGFGELRAATVRARFPAGDAEVVTADGYAVRLDRFELGVEEVVLLAHAEGGAAFDPAHPPEGYSGCHGGHCHGPDGALVAYAEIEAELGGGEGHAPIVTLPVGAAADLLAGAAYQLDVSGHGLLPAADVEELEVVVARVVIEGVVRREPDDGWSAPLFVDLALDGALVGHLELSLARGEDPGISLDVAVEPDGTLFDGIDFAALDAAGPDGPGGVVISDHEDPGGEAFEAALLGVEPAVTVERAP